LIAQSLLFLVLLIAYCFAAVPDNDDEIETEARDEAVKQLIFQLLPTGPIGKPRSISLKTNHIIISVESLVKLIANGFF